jgi:hypothetical protein
MRGALGRLIFACTFPAIFFGGQWLLGIHIPADISNWAAAAYVGCLLAAFAVGMVAHELGHALAIRLVGERVLGIEIGGRLGRVTFHAGTIPVSVGLGLGGHVLVRDHRLSAARRAAIYAAGPAANVLIAPLCLLLPLPRWECSLIALAVLASGLQDLAPIEADGHRTDGSRLFETPARRRSDAAVRKLLGDAGWEDRPGAAETLIEGFRLDVPEAEDCLRELSRQPERLMRMYVQPWSLPDDPNADVLHIVDVLTWKVLAAGDLAAGMADLAAGRAEWILDHLPHEDQDKRLPAWNARQTLALARLRQGRARDVRRLCADALAAEIDADDRATTLAIVAMARHALLLDGRPQLDEALTLDPNATLVGEARDRLTADVGPVPAPVPPG